MLSWFLLQKNINVCFYKGIIWKIRKLAALGCIPRLRVSMLCSTQALLLAQGVSGGRELKLPFPASSVQPGVLTCSSSSLVCIFCFEDRQGKNYSIILWHVTAISYHLGGIKVAVDGSSRAAEHFRLKQYSFLPLYFLLVWFGFVPSKFTSKNIYIYLKEIFPFLLDLVCGRSTDSLPFRQRLWKSAMFYINWRGKSSVEKLAWVIKIRF